MGKSWLSGKPFIRLGRTDVVISDTLMLECHLSIVRKAK
jgi:hypothetical protein